MAFCMMGLMAPSGIARARLACLSGFAVVCVLVSCGPPHAAVRTVTTTDGESIGGTGGGDGSGGTGGSVVVPDASAGTGGGGNIQRDTAVDPPAPLPDVAVDLAPPMPDLPADKGVESGPEGGAGKTVLLVMGYTTPKDAALRPGDTKLKARLEQRGFTVKMGDDDDPDASKAMGTNLVIITDTVGNQIGTKYTMLALPIICAEHNLMDDLRMTGNAGTDHNAANVSQVVITATGAAHPLAAGIMGSVMVAGGAQAATWGNPAMAAEKIATVPNQNNQTAIYGYSSGAMMSGMAAPARRVGFFAGDAMADNMNDNGWKLFDAAVDWALQP
jgi:hypothetical protein